MEVVARVSIVQVGRIIDTRDITIAVAQQPISIYRVSASALLLGFLLRTK